MNKVLEVLLFCLHGRHCYFITDQIVGCGVVVLVVVVMCVCLSLFLTVNLIQRKEDLL